MDTGLYCNREDFMLKQFCLTPSRTEENIFATVEPGGAGGAGGRNLAVMAGI